MFNGFIKKLIVSTKALTFLRFFFSRALGCYLLLALLILISVDVPKTLNYAYLTTLSRVCPPHKYLTQYARSEAPFSKKKFEEFLHYYQQVSWLFPKKADGLSMQAYCHYQLGNLKKSKKYLLKAIEYEPHFFGYHYNLGILYHKEGDYSNALKEFRLALKSNILFNTNYIIQSYIYLMFIEDPDRVQEEITLKLRSAYKRCTELALECCYKLKDGASMSTIAAKAIGSGFNLDGEFYFFTGLGFLLEGRPAKALPYMREAINRNPANPQGYQFMAEILVAMKKEEIAQQFLSKSIAFKDSPENFLSFPASTPFILY